MPVSSEDEQQLPLRLDGHAMPVELLLQVVFLTHAAGRFADIIDFITLIGIIGVVAIALASVTMARPRTAQS